MIVGDLYTLEQDYYFSLSEPTETIEEKEPKELVDVGILTKNSLVFILEIKKEYKKVITEDGKIGWVVFYDQPFEKIGISYKIKEFFCWFVYGIKEMAMNQTGPYDWYACSNKYTVSVGLEWAEYRSKKYNYDISCIFLNDTFTVLDEDERMNGIWKDSIIKILMTSGETGWVIKPHSQHGGYSENCFEKVAT